MKKSHIRLLLGAITVSGLFVVLSGFLFMQLFEPKIMEDSPTTADWIVVLGGGGTHRPDKAAELYHLGLAPKIIVSGKGDTEYVFDYLVKIGVPGQDLIPEPNSRSTFENALFSSRIIKKIPDSERVIVVTSNYHSLRAKACFEHLMPGKEIVSLPATFYSKQEDGDKKLEKIKMLFYWLFYGVSPF